MELDEAKATASKVDRRLEKPFDAETLRNLVKDLVPPLNQNLISNFLSFPEMPEMVEEPPAQAAPKAPAEEKIEFLKLDSMPSPNEVDEPEEFQSVPLPKTHPLPQKQALSAKDDWSQQDLSRYKIELPVEDDSYSLDEADLTRTSIALSSGIEEIALEDIDNPNPKPRKQMPSAPASKTFQPQSQLPPVTATLTPTPLPAVDPMRAEELLRQEARHVLESIAWKLLPDIVERVVREELQKLLKDAERL